MTVLKSAVNVGLSHYVDTCFDSLCGRTQCFQLASDSLPSGLCRRVESVLSPQYVFFYLGCFVSKQFYSYFSQANIYIFFNKLRETSGQ